jgi:hypothetical protein
MVDEEKIEEVIDRLENLIFTLNNPLPDRIHVECLREILPEVLTELKDALCNTQQ